MATEKVRLFSDKLRLFRKKRKITQDKMGEMLGVSRDYIYQIEAGMKNPGDTLKMMFDLLEQTPLRGEETKSYQVLQEAPKKYDAFHRVEAVRALPVYSPMQAGEVPEGKRGTEESEEKVAYLGSDPDAFGLKIQGDSMEPKFSSGDIAVVSPLHLLGNGELVVASIQHENVVFKLFHPSADGQVITLTSYNSAFPPILRAREQFHWIYRVVFVVKIF